MLGGLPTPRTPSERRGACVVRKDGRDAVSYTHLAAAAGVLLGALHLGAELAGTAGVLLLFRVQTVDLLLFLFERCV